MDRHPQILGENFRYKFGGGKRPKMPDIPAPVAQPQQISQKAQAAGTSERRRLFRRRGVSGNIYAGRRDLAPARTNQPQLRQKL